MHRILATHSFLACLILTSPTFAAESDADPAEEGLVACVPIKGGAIRALGAKAACRKNEREVTLAVEGDSATGEPSLHVFDGEGRDLGLFATRFSNSGTQVYQVFVEKIGRSILIRIEDGELESVGQSFLLPDCTGTSYAGTFYSGVVFPAFDPADTSLYVASTSEFSESVDILSRDRSFGGFCGNRADEQENAVPVFPFEGELGIDFPVPLPLSVGTLEPETPLP